MFKNFHTPHTHRLTIVPWVLLDANEEESGLEPFQSDGDVSDGVQHYLGIQVLDQVTVETARRKRRTAEMIEDSIDDSKALHNRTMDHGLASQREGEVNSC